jgi:DNA-binding CsgD family transcriptional regulator
MPDVESLRAAANEIGAVALTGGDWDGSLDRLARAAGAHGAVVMANRGVHTLSEIHSPEIDEPVAAFVAGQRPPSSRQARVPTQVGAGFRVDQDDYTPDELARDPYYQEFLRPFGFFWHANAALGAVRGNTIELSLKRRGEAGPFERADVAAFDAVLAELRGAATLALLSFEAETRGVTGFLSRTGDVVFELDRDGKVITHHGASSGLPLDVVAGRLRSRDATIHQSVDGAVRQATSRPGRPAARVLRAGEREWLFQTLPVPGTARDVFLAASALAIVSDLSVDRRSEELRLLALKEAFQLTRREAAIASLLCGGASMTEIAERLGLRRETARTHLKHVFHKTGVSRQAELVAIVSRLLF